MKETHTPISISALILKKLKNDFEGNSKYGEISSVVVTVPANFTNDARKQQKKQQKWLALI